MTDHNVHRDEDPEWLTTLIGEALDQAEWMLTDDVYAGWTNVGIWQGAIDNVADDATYHADPPGHVDRMDIVETLRERLKEPLPKN